MVTSAKRSYQVRRGDAWEGETFRVVSALGVSFWDGVAALAQMRAFPEGHLIYEFDLSHATVTSEDGNGVYTTSWSAPGSLTSKWAAGSYTLALRVSSNSLPAATLVEATMEVLRGPLDDC